MKIATILDHIDSGHMALPEFRGCLNREQVGDYLSHYIQCHPVVDYWYGHEPIRSV